MVSKYYFLFLTLFIASVDAMEQERALQKKVGAVCKKTNELCVKQKAHDSQPEVMSCYINRIPPVHRPTEFQGDNSMQMTHNVEFYSRDQFGNNVRHPLLGAYNVRSNVMVADHCMIPFPWKLSERKKNEQYAAYMLPFGVNNCEVYYEGVRLNITK